MNDPMGSAGTVALTAGSRGQATGGGVFAASQVRRAVLTPNHLDSDVAGPTPVVLQNEIDCGRRTLSAPAVDMVEVPNAVGRPTADDATPPAIESCGHPRMHAELGSFLAADGDRPHLQEAGRTPESSCPVDHAVNS